MRWCGDGRGAFRPSPPHGSSIMKPRDKGGASRARTGETEVRDLTRPLLHEILADARAATRPDAFRRGGREACDAARGHWAPGGGPACHRQTIVARGLG